MIRWWDLLPSPGFCGNFLGLYQRAVELCVKVLDKLFTDWSLLPFWDLMFVKDDFCLYNHAKMRKKFCELLRCCLQKKYILVNQDAATSTFTSKKEQQNNFLLHNERHDVVWTVFVFKSNLFPSNFMQTALCARHFTFPRALSDVANN